MSMDENFRKMLNEHPWKEVDPDEAPVRKAYARHLPIIDEVMIVSVGEDWELVWRSTMDPVDGYEGRYTGLDMAKWDADRATHEGY